MEGKRIDFDFLAFLLKCKRNNECDNLKTTSGGNSLFPVGGAKPSINFRQNFQMLENFLLMSKLRVLVNFCLFHLP